MAHNGNVINYRQLKTDLFEKYHRLLNSDNDVEAVLNVFAEELAAQRTKQLTPQNIYKAVSGVYRKSKEAILSSPTSPGRGWSRSAIPSGSNPCLRYPPRRPGPLLCLRLRKRVLEHHGVHPDPQRRGG